MAVKKHCKLCGKHLPATIDHFNGAGHNGHYLRSECKTCTQQAQRQRYALAGRRDRQSGLGRAKRVKVFTEKIAAIRPLIERALKTIGRE